MGTPSFDIQAIHLSLNKARGIRILEIMDRYRQAGKLRTRIAVKFIFSRPQTKIWEHIDELPELEGLQVKADRPIRGIFRQ